jgi:hypothetical protein
MMIRTKAIVDLILFAAFLQPLFAQQAGYRLKTTIALSNALDGFEGRLELLEDDRLTPELDKLLWARAAQKWRLIQKIHVT